MVGGTWGFMPLVRVCALRLSRVSLVGTGKSAAGFGLSTTIEQ